MRYRELYETDPASLGLRRLVNRSKPTITLRDLHKLKIIKNNRRKALQQKQKFLPVIYGSSEMHEDEYEMREREMEQIKQEIQLEIQKAEISQEDADHISDLALRAINKTG